ncbi:MAG: sulfotransferase family protein [Symploca sp. SIO2B6]|nr:sulfotransferase family protein [Symploca sp. SIO2B6]
MFGRINNFRRGIIRNAKRFRQRHFDPFIFIHINKTGGSSITKALNLDLQHRTALEKISELGEQKWQHSYTFAFVRNPWDKVVSHFHYRRRTNKTGLAERPIEFQDWVQLTYGCQDPTYYDKPKMFMPQTHWISNQNEEIIVDFVGRFESLDQDFEHVCKTIKKHVDLPHINPSKRKDYREYYNQNTIEIIEKWFHKDIENFGYRF